MKVRLTEDQIHDLFNKIKSDAPSLISDKDFERLQPILQKMIQYFSIQNKKEPVSGNPLLKPTVSFTNPKQDNMLQINNFNKNTPKNAIPMHPLNGKGRITSSFGLRNSKTGSKNHKGVDIGVASGTAVYAPLDGRVIESRDTYPNGCGGFIKLDHDQIQTKFCHLRKMIVRKGQEVKRGQVIGYSGGGKNDPMRGTSTGSHLHYEILNKSGIAMNPVTVQSNLA